MISLTFIGHATWLIEWPGGRVLTDPMLSSRIAGIWPRLNPPALGAEELPPVDTVLISHPHLDHMDIPTLRRLNRNATLAVPRETAGLAKRLGYRETAALDDWNSFEPAPGLKITAVPAIHVGIRVVGLGASARGAIGYVIEAAGRSIYFAGDTAYGPHFTQIRERTNPDVAILPIGAYSPWFFMKYFHMSPRAALRAFGDLGAEWCIPCHFGTFALSLEPARQPLQLFKREAARHDLTDRTVIVDRGQTAVFNNKKPQIKNYEKKPARIV